MERAELPVKLNKLVKKNNNKTVGPSFEKYLMWQSYLKLVLKR